MIDTTKEMLRGGAKVALVLGVLFGPILAVQNVNASSSYQIGELQSMSNGAGLVLLVGLQRS